MIDEDPRVQIHLTGCGPARSDDGADGHDLEGLTRPLLEALATLGALEFTYLTVFDWERRQQEVRFVHSPGGISDSTASGGNLVNGPVGGEPVVLWADELRKLAGRRLGRPAGAPSAQGKG